jgi:hypothetical protein
MGAPLNFLVFMPRSPGGELVASKMQVDIRTRQWCSPFYQHAAIAWICASSASRWIRRCVLWERVGLAST